MNYIRGAVNVISAPYQYYKDLPPINPSTLTGAIDVIVIQRPTVNGAMELACSPFHVRFGKWQVLRPGEKKVNVFVNGNSIPFNMKIGEAGEAFFVFETDDDVPADLITSPILQPTIPNNVANEPPEEKEEEVRVEPDFLDLDAGSRIVDEDIRTTPKQTFTIPKAIRRNSSRATIIQSSSLPLATQHPVRDFDERPHTPEMNEQDQRVDAALRNFTNEVHVPQAEYHPEVALDRERYNSNFHDRDQTQFSSSNHFPHRQSPSDFHSSLTNPSLVQTQSASHSPHAPSPSSSPSPPSSPSNSSASSPHPPLLRATSEPPPDMSPVSDANSQPQPSLPQIQEYSWEWGAFPQPSSIKASFSKGGRIESNKDLWGAGRKGRTDTIKKSRLGGMTLPPMASSSDQDQEQDGERPNGGGRSRSVPPLSEGNPTRKGRRSSREHKEYEDMDRYSRHEHEENIDFNVGADNRKREEDKTETVATADGKDSSAVSLGTNSTGGAKKPTSSSWVQWWSRSRKRDTNAKDIATRVEKVNEVLDSNTGSSSSSVSLPPKSSKNMSIYYGQFAINESVPSTPPRDLVHSTTKVPDQDTTPTRHALSATTTKKFAKTLRLTSDQLKTLDLRPGANTITFSLSATGAVAATARIFVWDSTDLVVVSDIDGTITKSDGLGHVFAMIGRDWTHVGVAKLYTDIARNGYKIMYLTSRAIGQADATRDYLKGIKQNDYQLPEGPVIMSPDRLMASLHREVIMRKPEVFKMACLRDIQRLFGESARSPFYAGFGNRITDALSYRSVNVPSARIFTIDSSGEVKMELLELAGYKSSYIHMTDLVDQMFPPIHRKWTPEFTDFNYWKVPLREYTLPDLSPPSPALSARSDASNQSALARLRNFSLGGNSARGGHITDNFTSYDSTQAYRNSHLRQMSSFEKLSSTLGFMTGINSGDPSPLLSTSYAGSDDEDGDESDDGKPRTRRRRKSMTSMPGTLDEMHFDMDDEDEEHSGHYEDDDGEEGYNGDENGVGEEEFDEDLLVAGAMQKVPFL